MLKDVQGVDRTAGSTCVVVGNGCRNIYQSLYLAHTKKLATQIQFNKYKIPQQDSVRLIWHWRRGSLRDSPDGASGALSWNSESAVESWKADAFDIASYRKSFPICPLPRVLLFPFVGSKHAFWHSAFIKFKGSSAEHTFSCWVTLSRSYDVRTGTVFATNCEFKDGWQTNSEPSFCVVTCI